MKEQIVPVALTRRSRFQTSDCTAPIYVKYVGEACGAVESPLKKRANESEPVLRDVMCVVRYVALQWNLEQYHHATNFVMQGYVFLARFG